MYYTYIVCVSPYVLLYVCLPCTSTCTVCGQACVVHVCAFLGHVQHVHALCISAHCISNLPTVMACDLCRSTSIYNVACPFASFIYTLPLHLLTVSSTPQ